MPGSGGVRVILVAGIKEAATRAQQQAAAEAAAPPVKGVVSLGPNSRMAIEFQDDALQMFYILDIVNNARARVDIGGPLVLDLPEGAGAPRTEGSSPSATVSGDRLTVTEPFAVRGDVRAGGLSAYAHRAESRGPADVARGAGAAHGRGGEGGCALDLVTAVLDRRRNPRLPHVLLIFPGERDCKCLQAAR